MVHQLVAYSAKLRRESDGRLETFPDVRPRMVAFHVRHKIGEPR
jgi:hypothetical protein